MRIPKTEAGLFNFIKELVTDQLYENLKLKLKIKDGRQQEIPEPDSDRIGADSGCRDNSRQM